MRKKLDEVIKENQLDREARKLPVLAKLMTPAPESSKGIIYTRNPANSTFYNTRDLSISQLYKPTSLILPEDFYEDISK